MGVSFVDDIRSLPDSVRLVAQFAAMVMMFYQLDILHWNMWWMVLVALVVCVGAADVINFMDGVNGITGAYALASLVPLALLNAGMGFVAQSLIYVVILARASGMGLVAWHWIYLVVALVVLAVAYVLFMRKYYHLHEEYLRRVRGER